MPKWRSNFPVVRVSSVRSPSTDFNTSTAREVISPKFPMGVGMRYNLLISDQGGLWCGSPSAKLRKSAGVVGPKKACKRVFNRCTVHQSQPLDQGRDQSENVGIIGPVHHFGGVVHVVVRGDVSLGVDKNGGNPDVGEGKVIAVGGVVPYFDVQLFVGCSIGRP